MATIMLQEVLQLARQLPRRQQQELIAQLTHDVALDQDSMATASPDAWARLDRFRAELAALGSTTPTLAGQLDADRRSRQAALEGTPHVHP